MSAPDFGGLLQQQMGLDAASIGVSAIDSAVRMRLIAHGVHSLQDYWDLVCASAPELQALIEAVVVPETWFFRDREAFTAVTHHAMHDWQSAHPEDTLRLLSLPCSTGEEPYSMAMALLDAGFSMQRCHIDAVDISTLSLARARRGIYGKNSFRGEDLAYRNRHFTATSDGFRINDAPREVVHFQQGNLLAAGFLGGVASYDVIFCRNLLIYFNPETQCVAADVLQHLLKPDGMLCVGPSEGALPLRHGFDSMRIPLAQAFRRRSFKAAARPQPCSTPAPYMSATASSSIPTPLPVLVEPAVELVADASLDEASRLADQGDFLAAARACEQALQNEGPSVRAFYLLGLIESASGNLAVASDHYRKALYLDPNHYETLVHLCMLLEEQGNAAQARVLRGRMERLQLKSYGT